ncbi:acyl carrier protein [Pseudorhodobacter sp.]|uniref:acyl carrier protein n=1 Tax=Pseudorhodobacter sp. TaxID=1934400 RepID=UPI00264823B0|nr:acyl carrier protein [Pseudorhodobacter sp.]MDN5787600.1 acyl carrier protein [Pseudorhodobacter sp.]
MSISKDKLDSTIRRIFAEVFTMQADGAPAPDLAGDTILLNTGMDSLGFAILVTMLEEELGFDPFSLSTEAYYPSTYDEFLTFYLGNQPA